MRAAQDVLDRGGYSKVSCTTNVNVTPPTVLIDDETAKRLEQTLREMEDNL